MFRLLWMRKMPKARWVTGWFWVMVGLLGLLAVGCGETSTAVPTAIPPTIAPTERPTVVPTATVMPTATPEPTAVDGAISVRVDIDRGEISPWVYGTNNGPWNTIPGDFFDEFEAAGLTWLRFPGGNWGDTNKLRSFHIKQQMAWAEMIDARVNVSVNLPEGTIEDALALMDMVDEMGFDRVASWSIGNEPSLYQDKQMDEWTTAFYNVRWREFAVAMEEKDPDIVFLGPDIHQIGATSATRLKDSEGLDWLEEFLKANGDMVDVVTFHRYPFPRNPNDAPASAADLRANSAEWEAILPEVRRLVQLHTGEELPIGITEINSHWSRAFGTDGSPDSHMNAIWWGDVLGRMINHEVEYVAQFTVHHATAGYSMFGNSVIRPNYYVYPMYKMLGDQLVWSASGIEHVSVVSAVRDDGALTVMLINLNDEAVDAPLQVDGTIREQWLFDEAHPAEQVSVDDQETIALSGRSMTLLVLDLD